MTTSLALQCDGANWVPPCAASACTSALLWTKWRVDWTGRQQRSAGSKRICQCSLHEGQICAYDMSPTKVKLIELDRERYEQT